MNFIRILLTIAFFFAISPTIEASNIPSTKAWTVTFSQPIEPNSLSSETMYITTPSGSVHPASITLLNDTTAQLTPTTPYKERGTYTISVQNIKSTQHSIVTPYTQTFTFTPVPKATWIWNAYNLTESDAQFLIAEGVTKVYVQVESELPHDAYVPFFKTLHAHNIDIYALEGFAGLQFQDEAKTSRFLQWITEFQQHYDYFTGIHVDVEPYTDTSWQQHEQHILQQYFTYIQSLRHVAHSLNLQFEIDMPFWFDSIIYTNNFGTGNVAHWLIDNSDEVTIMAYRNDAATILPLVADEFAYATSQHKQITIALETAESFEGEFLSFHNKSALALYETLDILYATYGTTIALHYLPAWQALVNR